MISVVVPLFNEEQNIGPLLDRLKGLKEKLVSDKLEIILVDDGSQDYTFNKLKQLANEHLNIHLIKLTKNFGSHSAIMAGLSKSNGDCVIFLAGDLQDPPELVIDMLEKWRQGFRIVWAARTHVEGNSIRDNLFSCLYWQLSSWITDKRLPATGVDFALLDRDVINYLKQQSQKRGSIFIQIANSAYDSEIVHYTKVARIFGKSSWTLKKKISLTLETIFTSPKFMLSLSVWSVASLAAIFLLCIGVTYLPLIHTYHQYSRLIVLSIIGILFAFQVAFVLSLREYFKIESQELTAARFVIGEYVPCMQYSPDAEL